MDKKQRNDNLRKQIPYVLPPNLLVVTPRIAELEDIDEVIAKVRDFDDFNEDNDPWGEHDFGAFDHNGKRIFWKVDDYGGAEGYELVLTIMLAEEY
jgi:hypothetical protein